MGWKAGGGIVTLEQVRDKFVADMLGIAGACELLWVPGATETTISTDRSRNARVLTYDASKEGAYGQQGSGLYLPFDGSDDEADTPDAGGLSFGDGALDEPFSIVSLVYVTDPTPAAANTILAKWNLDTDGELREWRALLTATNGYPRIELYDESANAYIGREDQTPLSATAWTLLAFTYDGSRASTGLRVYVDASRLDDADSNSGTYTAMENTTAIVGLAHTLSAAATPVATEFWDGRRALDLLTRKELTIDEIWALKSAVNAYYGLSL